MGDKRVEEQERDSGSTDAEHAQRGSHPERRRRGREGNRRGDQQVRGRGGDRGGGHRHRLHVAEPALEHERCHRVANARKEDE
jgi:hypothetical protein